MSPPVEVRWFWRRVYTYGVTVVNSAGVGAIVWRLNDAQALKWLGLALVGANVVTATLYLAGATVTDWAKLAHAARTGGT
jgi:formylmethanofuran dehydrogenase subunit A